MKYSNPEIPEGINTSPRHPLKEFFLLTFGVLSIVVIAVIVLGFMADRLAHYLPFSYEKNFADEKFLSEEYQAGEELQKYLEELGSRIARAQGIEDDMPITLHYLDDETVNAFATLGGHVFLFRGLLEKLPNENALAMVLAHEIAHIKHRHPIRGMGRGIIIGLALTIVSSSLSDVMVDSILSDTSMLTSLSFTRDQERESDVTALDTLMVMYGTTAGAEKLFELLLEQEDSMKVPEFFNTHPLSENRINSIHSYRRSLEDKNTKRAVTPLPTGFQDWLLASTADTDVSDKDKK